MFIHNIQSVSKYESKLLIRSWFFKIFTLLAIVILTFFNWAMLASEDSGGFWAAKAIPSNIPYINLLLLNTGQAIIAIFLASDFLKRDKKLDTSEVFYVRPLSNAEYVIGKIWGNLRVFLILNLIVMAISLLFTCMVPAVRIDWGAYLIYFFIISIPTLLFIIGLSIFLMLVLRNQALTFILLLGYVGLTLFYISDKYYYLFDYMAYYLPLLKSTIVGFTNTDAIFTHRGIYFCAGLGFIFITIALFGRLPNSKKSNYPWLLLAICMFILAGYAGYTHVYSIVEKGYNRNIFIQVNNKYATYPKMVIDQYDIVVEQHADHFSAEVHMSGNALKTSSIFSFCLNPALRVKEIKSGDEELGFERDQQVILVNFGKEIEKQTSIELNITYEGRIDDSFCYLDIPEKVMQEEYRDMLFSADKQYSFQTEDYLLLTPETYWYPRPGTAYSDENSNWQQNYFSTFKLRVTPLKGLTPISQGDAIKNDDGSYSFTPEYPIQAISLASGKYKQQTIETDSIRYSVFHIEGHDYYTTVFDSIRDTLPKLITNFKENIERTYKLNYPFRRFSIVEVPAQFYSYPHAWSQAQEVIQPEMVLFTEKGWKYHDFDVAKRKKNQFKWAKWSKQEINETEAEIRTFNEMIRLFSNTEGNRNFSSAGRGQYSIQSTANPYFLFPLLYNFRYNIFSPDWPITNRLVELYLQNKADNNGWERDINGISNNEKASLLMEKENFKDLLADVEHRDLINNIVSLKAYWLFAPAEINIGVNTFRDSLYSMLQRNTFKNIQFESLLDTLGRISDTDIRSGISEWNYPTQLPYYSIQLPEITRFMNRGQESFVLKLLISNDSDNPGYIQMNIMESGGRSSEDIDPRTNRKIKLDPHQRKQLISVWENAPRAVVLNTLISGNLPSTIEQPLGNIKRERGAVKDKEGDYTLPDRNFDIWGEIIVDNEDSLFFLSEADVVGLLPQWLDEVEDTSFKYSGISWWRPPLQWTATTNARYFGKYIRSAYVIKSGSGSQTATWRVPIPSEGNYEVYYYASKDQEARNNNRSDAEYHFKIKYDNEIEEAYLNLRRANEGWEQLGVYYFSSDTIDIVLTNETKLKSVAADAVKVVKR